MILTVYGDEWAAASHARKPFSWAIQDHWYITRGYRAHPDNITAGFGYKTAKLMHIGFHSGVTANSTVDNICNDCLALADKNRITVVISWNEEHCKQLSKIESLSAELIERQIDHSFINTGSCFSSSSEAWIWDTSKHNLQKWTETNGLGTDHGYLTPIGHTRLANLVLLHLTRQLDNLILVE